jgi:hypothetical protein
MKISLIELMILMMIKVKGYEMNFDEPGRGGEWFCQFYI